MPTPHTGTALSLSHFYSTRFYVYPLLLTNHFNRNRKLQDTPFWRTLELAK